MGVKLNLKGLSKVSSSISSLSEPEEMTIGRPLNNLSTYTTSAIACTAHAHEQSSPVQSPGFALAPAYVMTAHVNIFATVTSSTTTKITKKLCLTVQVAIAEDAVL